LIKKKNKSSWVKLEAFWQPKMIKPSNYNNNVKHQKTSIYYDEDSPALYKHNAENPQLV